MTFSGCVWPRDYYEHILWNQEPLHYVWDRSIKRSSRLGCGPGKSDDGAAREARARDVPW